MTRDCGRACEGLRIALPCFSISDCGAIERYRRCLVLTVCKLQPWATLFWTAQERMGRKQRLLILLRGLWGLACWPVTWSPSSTRYGAMHLGSTVNCCNAPKPCSMKNNPWDNLGTAATRVNVQPLPGFVSFLAHDIQQRLFCDMQQQARCIPDLTIHAEHLGSEMTKGGCNISPQANQPDIADLRVCACMLSDFSHPLIANGFKSASI